MTGTAAGTLVNTSVPNAGGVVFPLRRDSNEVIPLQRYDGIDVTVLPNVREVICVLMG